MTAFERARLVLGAVGTAGFLLAACTSGAAPAAPSPATKEAPAATMDLKDGGAMEKTDAMEPAKSAMESGAMTEKTEGTTDAAMMETTDAMEPAKTAMESGSMMEKTEGSTDTAMMEKSDGMMTDQKESGAMQTQASTTRKLPDQRLSPHFVVSSPKHGETLVQVPERIQINFDFTLHESSAIAVTKDGTPVQAGMIPVNPRGLVLAATLPPAGNGLYVVGYKACWPDRSCHDGQFAFTVQP